jgi:two-component system LytT family response regulator
MKTPGNKIRVIIVDDEPIAREGVRVQVLKDRDAEVVAECKNGLEAVAAIREIAPDLVFLDVQMPGMDGFEVLREIDTKEGPAIIFVTAFDQYALQAFEVNAVDYLLKPFDSERFERAFTRAKSELKRHNFDALSRRLHRLIATLAPPEQYLERLVIKSSGRIFFLPVNEIDWIEASDNYVTLHVGREAHLVRGTLTSFEKKLSPNKFLRIRHSALVNVKRIQELQPLFKGEYELLLRGGARLRSSRRYHEKISELIGQ